MKLWSGKNGRQPVPEHGEAPQWIVSLDLRLRSVGPYYTRRSPVHRGAQVQTFEPALILYSTQIYQSSAQWFLSSTAQQIAIFECVIQKCRKAFPNRWRAPTHINGWKTHPPASRLGRFPLHLFLTSLHHSAGILTISQKRRLIFVSFPLKVGTMEWFFNTKLLLAHTALWSSWCCPLVC